MSNRAYFTYLLLTMVVVSLTGPAMTTKAATDLIPIVNIIIPASVDEAAQKVIIDKLTGLKQQGYIYLDLTIVYRRKGEGVQPFTLTVNGKPYSGSTNSTDHGPLLMAANVVYHMGPIANYNHLLMSVYTEDRSAFPYNDVSLEYSGTGNDHILFHVRGFFYVLGNDIPTAISLQLRPFNPPFALA